MHDTITIRRCRTETHYALKPTFEYLSAKSQKGLHIELFVATREPPRRVRGRPGVERESSVFQNRLRAVKRNPLREILSDDFVDLDEVTRTDAPDALYRFWSAKIIDEGLAQEPSSHCRVVHNGAHSRILVYLSTKYIAITHAV
jgi:hypothetical protein